VEAYSKKTCKKSIQRRLKLIRGAFLSSFVWLRLHVDMWFYGPKQGENH
jgi:hypothetical protein